MRRPRVLSWIVMFALGATACSGGGNDTDRAAPAPSTIPPLGPLLDVGELEAPERCDPLDTRHCLLPFPSDTFTVDDPGTDTKKRIAFARASMPANKDGVRVDPAEWNRNDGFSPGQPVSVFVPGLDVAQSGIAGVTDIGRSLAADAPIVLLDATTGKRHPYWAELDASVEADGDRVLYVRPAVNYQEGHRMVVAFRGLRDRAGATIAARSRVFVAYRDRRATGNEVLESRRPRYEQVFADLAAAGVPRGDLFLAWDFTVASERNLSERMLTIRDDAFSALGDASPRFTVTNVEEHPEPNLFRRVEGTLLVPLYLTGSGEPGSRFVGADRGEMPGRNGDALFEAQFVCIVPNAARNAPARLSLYGHGLLGSPREVNASNVRAMADEHGIVFCATAWIGMASEDIPNAVSILNDLSKFATLADRSQQGFLNALFLARAMKHPSGFATHEAFRGLIDTSAVFYDGNSQGGIMGGALTAVSTEFTRAVLGVPAMNYSTLLQRSVDWDTYRAIFDPAYPDVIERGIGISLVQMLWDRAEANGYAHHMTTDPLPGTPGHRVLMHVAFGDHQVSPYAAEVEARTIGARLHCPATEPGRLPDAEPHWGIPCVDGGRDDGSVLVIWDSGTPAPPTVNLAPRDGADSHEDPRADAAARRQKSEFLKNDGAFVDVCAGAPCKAAPVG
jgi:hypothetical protein